jgi:hypothetical protein
MSLSQTTSALDSGANPVSEDLIVRDLLFVFQGIQGQYIHYSLVE